MQLTKEHNSARGMDYIFKRLAENTLTKKNEVLINQQIIREYVDDLLTPAEQRLCDMATD